MKKLFSKMKTSQLSPKRVSLKHICWAWVGSAMAIGLVAYASSFASMPLIFAPLGASAVLAFAVSDSPLAQPRNIIGGHFVSAFVAILFLLIFGSAWWVTPLAVASAIAAMQFTKTVHPPAGANPIIVVMTAASWDFLIMTVVPGAILLTMVAIIFNNLDSDRRYPTYWW